MASARLLADVTSEAKPPCSIPSGGRTYLSSLDAFVGLFVFVARLCSTVWNSLPQHA
jgi:hypothetical protein